MTDEINVLKSVARIVTINGLQFRLWAEDWDSIKDCETAASKAGYHFQLDRYYEDSLGSALDHLADSIAEELHLDPDRPLGRTLIAEPV